MVQGLRHKHPLERLLLAARLSRSTFYYHLKALGAVDQYAGLKQRIGAVYARHKGRYGYRRIASFELMMVVVSAGFALGLAGAPHIGASRELGVVARPLAGGLPMLTTYLLRRESDASEVLSRFIERVQTIDLPEGTRPALPPAPDPQEEIEP